MNVLLPSPAEATPMSTVLLCTICCSRHIDRCRKSVQKAAGHEAAQQYLHQPLESAAQGEHDLLSGINSRLQRDVVLQMETAKSAEAKLRKSITSFFVLLGYASVVALTIVKGANSSKARSQTLQGLLPDSAA